MNNLLELAAKCGREHYSQIAEHFDGTSLKKQLVALMQAAERRE